MLYIGIGLAGLLPMAWALDRRRDAALVATVFVALAFIHTTDWLASGALGLYKYHPGLVADSVLEDALGELLAEVGFVTALAVMLVALVPAWWGALIGSGIVTAIEYWFTSAGALEISGWKHWYTTVGFIIYFFLVRQYWLWARRRGVLDEWPLLLARLALAFSFNGLFEILLWGAKAATSSITLLTNPENNQALMRFIWHLGIFVPLCYWVIAGTQFTRPQRLLAALAISITVKQFLVTTGLRTFAPPWNPALHGLVQFLFFTAAGLADDWIRSWAKQPQAPARAGW